MSIAVFIPPAARDRCEGLTRVGEDNGCARCCLIAPDDDVDVEWIELDTAAHPPGILGSLSVDPEPRKGSRTISPRFVRSISASSNIAVGFTVG